MAFARIPVVIMNKPGIPENAGLGVVLIVKVRRGRPAERNLKSSVLKLLSFAAFPEPVADGLPLREQTEDHDDHHRHSSR